MDINWERSAEINNISINELRIYFEKFPNSQKHVIRICVDCGDEKEIIFGNGNADRCASCAPKYYKVRLGVTKNPFVEIIENKYISPQGPTKNKIIEVTRIGGIIFRTNVQVNLKTDNIGIYSDFISEENNIKKNRYCSDFLGIYVAENVLSKIYKNVNTMPRGNHGYDFICDGGYKIDVKSSVMRGNDWSFAIHKNIITDYFLCLAFDNREDLNPIHIWLIPGNVLNELVGTTIAKSKVDKWKKYELNIDKVIEGCNIMKEDK